ncbi:MAG: acetamidase/formamidase family protein [Bryobacterales bacterium]|nr:acetamidase/formamidase family protein [Bryobacterales bacterium]
MTPRLPLQTILAAAILAGGVQAAPVNPTVFYNSFDHRHPVLARVQPGVMVETRTIDAGGIDEHGKRSGVRGNPLTGPFYIEGAEPGDSIEVRLHRIRMNRDWGFSTFRLGLYSLDPESIEGLYSPVRKPNSVIEGRDSIVRWHIDRQAGKVRLEDPVSRVHKLEFAAVPMLGCVGVAAPGVFAPTSGISGPYGGNMDYNRINEGTSVYLPVYHPGALLFLGDGHALQADGEPNGTGVETSMEVAFEVRIHKKKSLKNPRVTGPDFISSVGSQPEFVSSLDRALRIATSDMVEWLVTEYKLEPWAAHLLISYAGQYDVVTVGGSVALRLPRTTLPAVP